MGAPSLGTRALSSGQVLVAANLEEGPAATDALRMIEFVKQNLQQYGQVFAMSRITSSSNGSFRAIVEFCNVTAAMSALRIGRDLIHIEVRLLFQRRMDVTDLDHTLCREQS